MAMNDEVQIIRWRDKGRTYTKTYFIVTRRGEGVVEAFDTWDEAVKFKTKLTGNKTRTKVLV